MKKYSISYLLGESFKSLWRNGVMSMASVTVLMSCLVVIGGFLLIILNINLNVDKLGLMNEFVAFADYHLSSEEVDDIQRQIESLDNIRSIERITKEEALEKM